MSSGAISTANMIPKRRDVTFDHGSCGPGMLGCTATQVHKNIVDKQLQTMCHNPLQLFGLSEEVAWSTIGMGAGLGLTLTEIVNAWTAVRTIIATW
jgi:hypothetical protein